VASLGISSETKSLSCTVYVRHALAVCFPPSLYFPVTFELFLHGIREFIFARLLFLAESFVHNNISCIEY